VRALTLCAQFAAPLLRVLAPGGADQLDRLALLTADQLHAAAAASAVVLQQQLFKLQQLLQDISRAQDNLKEQLDKEPGKYQIKKMEVGSIDDFHRGLTDRIG